MRFREHFLVGAATYKSRRHAAERRQSVDPLRPEENATRNSIPFSPSDRNRIESRDQDEGRRVLFGLPRRRRAQLAVPFGRRPDATQRSTFGR